MPATQVPFSQMVAVTKTTGEPRSLIPAVTRVVNGMDQDIPLFGVKSMEEYLAASVATPRFSTTLLSIFAGVALVLTVVGLYGVMSYSVAQRTNEIGIRLALGAQTRDVLLMVVKHGSKLILIGLAIGLAAAYALTRLDREFAVWCDGEGSVDVRSSGSVARDRRVDCVLCACVARDES